VYRGKDEGKDKDVREERAQVTRRVFRKWQAIAMSYPNDPYQETSGGRYEAFWRTLMFNQFADCSGPPTSDFNVAFEAWMSNGVAAPSSPYFAALSDYEKNAHMKKFSNSAISRYQKRAFVITEKGYFGLALKRVQKGDLVTILREGRVPFVLGKSNSGFRFMGETYVHGIMNGEQMKEAKIGDVQEFELT